MYLGWNYYTLYLPLPFYTLYLPLPFLVANWGLCFCARVTSLELIEFCNSHKISFYLRLSSLSGGSNELKWCQKISEYEHLAPIPDDVTGGTNPPFQQHSSLSNWPSLRNPVRQASKRPDHDVYSIHDTRSCSFAFEIHLWLDIFIFFVSACCCWMAVSSLVLVTTTNWRDTSFNKYFYLR